jgi:hypothetical protein
MVLIPFKVLLAGSAACTLVTAQRSASDAALAVAMRADEIKNRSSSLYRMIIYYDRLFGGQGYPSIFACTFVPTFVPPLEL